MGTNTNFLVILSTKVQRIARRVFWSQSGQNFWGSRKAPNENAVLCPVDGQKKCVLIGILTYCARAGSYIESFLPYLYCVYPENYKTAAVKTVKNPHLMIKKLKKKNTVCKSHQFLVPSHFCCENPNPQISLMNSFQPCTGRASSRWPQVCRRPWDSTLQNGWSVAKQKQFWFPSCYWINFILVAIHMCIHVCVYKYIHTWCNYTYICIYIMCIFALYKYLCVYST